jgi:hypothetical protein
MASRTQEEILKHFEAVAWKQAVAAPEVDAVTADTLPHENFTAAPAGVPVTADPPGWSGATMAGATMAATTAGENVPGGPKTETSSGGGASTVATVIKDFFETGFGLGPLLGGLFGLFGGGSETPPPPVKYQMPSPISFMSADVGHSLTAADYDEMGLPRAYTDGGASPIGPTGSIDGYDSNPDGSQNNSNGAAGQPAGNSATAPPQITVNVQAMDAQSFLDRSHDIAQAVRSAMLNMSSINDVVSEL